MFVCVCNGLSFTCELPSLKSIKFSQLTTTIDTTTTTVRSELVRGKVFVCECCRHAQPLPMPPFSYQVRQYAMFDRRLNTIRDVFAACCCWSCHTPKARENFVIWLPEPVSSHCCHLTTISQREVAPAPPALHGVIKSKRASLCCLWNSINKVALGYAL